MHALDSCETRHAGYSLVSGVSRQLDKPASQLMGGLPA